MPDADFWFQESPPTVTVDGADSICEFLSAAMAAFTSVSTNESALTAPLGSGATVIVSFKLPVLSVKVTR